MLSLLSDNAWPSFDDDRIITMDDDDVIVPYYFDDRAYRSEEKEVIDLSVDVDDPPFAHPPFVPAPAPFDQNPVLVMRDDDVREERWCDECTILFHYRSELHRHVRSERHAQMVSFLGGEPMMYCVVCNWLPDMPHLHLEGSRHAKGLRRLARSAIPTDMEIREVLIGADGRRYAVLLPPA